MLGKSLRKDKKFHRTLYLSYNRKLAKMDTPYVTKNTVLQNMIKDNRNKSKFVNLKKNNTTYEMLQRDKPNHLENYMKEYNDRYSKKRGLSKLDCYCEKKLFNTIYKAHIFAEKIKRHQKSYTRIIFKRIGIPIILLSLFPLLGVIIPAFRASGFHIILKECENTGSAQSPTWKHDKCKEISNMFNVGNQVFLYIYHIVILIVIIYIIIKIVKYEKIKSGKVKMNLKEYCRLCKDVFI